MKQYILLGIVAALLFACKPEEEIFFQVDTGDLAVSFEAYEGGAYMNYTLPANTEIYGIQAKYKDFKGKEITVKGTHTGKQLDLFGFIEQEDAVPVEISLINLDGLPSKPIEETFATLASVTFTIFDKLEIASHWNGFRSAYPEIEGRTQGFMHIYYVGINPETNQIDSLLVSSRPISNAGVNFRFADIEDESIDKVTVVVKTEDYRGNFVKKKVYPNIPVERAMKFDSQKIEFEGSSIEDEDKRIGWKYLFDGDDRGIQCLETGDHAKEFAYRSEKEAEFDGNNVMTLDLQDGKEIAWIRIYSILSAKIPNSFGQYLAMKLGFQFFYPSHVTLYGTNDKDSPEESWVEIGSFYQSATVDRESRWSAPGFDSEDYYTIDEIDLFKAAEPNYIQLDCDITGNTYQYLKVKINETFYFKTETYEIGVTGEYGMEELEVYVKKEE